MIISKKKHQPNKGEWSMWILYGLHPKLFWLQHLWL